jgi:hypothetical protein
VGKPLSLNLTPGTWAVRWIDPSTGDELNQSRVETNNHVIELEIPEGPEHRIIYSEKDSS